MLPSPRCTSTPLPFSAAAEPLSLGGHLPCNQADLISALPSPYPSFSRLPSCSAVWTAGTAPLCLRSRVTAAFPVPKSPNSLVLAHPKRCGLTQIIYFFHPQRAGVWINKVSVKHPKCYVSAKDDYQRLKCSELLCSDVMGRKGTKRNKTVRSKCFPQKQAQSSSHISVSVPPSHPVSIGLFWLSGSNVLWPDASSLHRCHTLTLQRILQLQPRVTTIAPY